MDPELLRRALAAALGFAPGPRTAAWLARCAGWELPLPAPAEADLDPLLDAAWRGRGRAERRALGQVFTPRAVARQVLLETPGADRDELVDPACGGGIFLVEAAALRAERWRAEGRPADPIARDLLATVHGIDLDPEACRLARLLLGLEVVRQTPGAEDLVDGWPLPSVTCGDATDPDVTAPLAGRVRAVVGNPPYREAKGMPAAERDRLRERFAVDGAFDVYLCFVLLALELVGPGGSVGYVLPNKLLVARYAAGLRRRLSSEDHLRAIVDLSELDVFGRVGVYPVLVVLGPPVRTGDIAIGPARLAKTAERPPLPQGEGGGEGSTPTTPGSTRRAARRGSPAPRWGEGVRTEPVGSLLVGSFKATFAVRSDAELGRAPLPGVEVPTDLVRRLADPPVWLTVPAGPLVGLLDRLAGRVAPLRDQVEVRSTCSFHAKGLRERFVRPGEELPDGLPYLGGRSFSRRNEVQPFRVDWQGYRIRFDEDELRAIGNPLPPRGLFLRPKVVLCQHARSPIAWFDAEGRFVTKDVYPVASARAGFRATAALCAVLDSRVFAVIYALMYRGIAIGSGYLHVLPAFLHAVPLPPLDEALADAVMSLQAAPDRAGFEVLDQRVSELYGLTRAERDAVVAFADTRLGFAPDPLDRR